MSRLVNAELDELVSQLSTYQTGIAEAVYDQYKRSTVLGKTINLKGETGDAMKRYMELVHVNLAQKVINVSAELLEAAKKIKEDFTTYESDAKGIVGTGTLDKETESLSDSKEVFDGLDKRGEGLVQRAAEFITTTQLTGETVRNTYQLADKNIKETKEKLLSTDEACTARMTPVIERINELLLEMREVSTYFKNKNGVIADNVEKIKDQSWYTLENRGAFDVMAEEDPFTYHAGHASVAEGQWVAGTSDKNYLSATGYVLGAQGMYLNEKGLTKAEGEFAAAKGTIKGESLDGYLKLDGQGEVLSASGKGEWKDWTDFNASANAQVLKGKATAVAGTKEFNGYASAEVNALSADGIVAFKTQKNEDDNVHVALKGGVNGVNAKAKAGFTLFGMEEAGGAYKVEDGPEDKQKKRFGGSLAVSAGFQAGGGVEWKDTVVVKTDYANIRATSIAADLKLILGVEFDVTVPTVQLKWPW